ncbi:SMI1/KNR4 family protein [Undibacterium sp. Ji42W]|uniref:SMI1/KNR4 family protein n=1 Tax=Undibacterium sp. Ji42W TaxID=3413039 RepID=UPI003BF26CA4
MNKNLKFFLVSVAILFLLSSCNKQTDDKKEMQLNSKDVASVDSNFDAWERFLGCWEHEISDIQKKKNKTQPSLWKKTQRLSVDSIDALEKRLKSRLPQSYRDFLTVSNGQFQLLGQLSWNFSDSAFHSIDKVILFANSSGQPHKAWINAYEDTEVPDEEYFVYGEKQNVPAIRAIYLNEAIEISHFPAKVEEFILLNPHVKTQNGEFETWWLSPRHPGAMRYKTFADFMISIYYEEIHNGSWDPTESQIADSCGKYIYKRY